MLKAFIFNPFMELTYVISDSQNNAVIIDCGCYTQQEQQTLVDYIETNHLNPIALLNTHFHLDHQFGNALINQRYGLLPYGSELDRPLIDVLELQASWFGLPHNSEIITSINPLTDNQKLKFGNLNFTVIATPGHTPGGLCFLLHQDEAPDILFSGDTLFCNGYGRTDLPYGNTEQLFHSISNRLLTLPEDTKVYPGHGVATTIGNEKHVIFT